MKPPRPRIWITLLVVGLGLFLGSHAPGAGSAIINLIAQLATLDLAKVLKEREAALGKVQWCADGI